MTRLAQILPLVSEVIAAIVAAIRGGGTVAEVRKRLADGIQRGDLISDEALRLVGESADAVEDFIKNG